MIEARAQATSVKIDASSLTEENMSKFEAAQSKFTGSLNRLMAVAEQYPNLMSINQFAKLQDEIAGTENRIGTARTDFNQTIMNYNLSVRSFPSNIFANLFGFQQKAAFKATEGSDKAPDLDKIYDKE